MSTQTQIIANRLNALKSTGPKTPQGKAVVSQNALKHGLSARHDVITTESQEEYDRHREALLNELNPQGPMESMLADRIVSLSWRLKRADQIQNQTIDAMNEKNTANPLANLAKSFGLKGLATPQHPNTDLTLGRIALKDFSNERVLDRLLMYERRIEHSLFKTTLELQRLHLLRNLETPEVQPEPEHRRLAHGPVPWVTTQQNKTPEPPIPHSQQNLAPGFTGGPLQKPSENQRCLTPAFTRRRHACPERSRRDNALIPNSTPRTKEPRSEAQIRPSRKPSATPAFTRRRHACPERSRRDNAPVRHCKHLT